MGQSIHFHIHTPSVQQVGELLVSKQEPMTSEWPVAQGSWGPLPHPPSLLEQHRRRLPAHLSIAQQLAPIHLGRLGGCIFNRHYVTTFGFSLHCSALLFLFLAPLCIAFHGAILLFLVLLCFALSCKAVVCFAVFFFAVLAFFGRVSHQFCRWVGGCIYTHRDTLGHTGWTPHSPATVPSELAGGDRGSGHTPGLFHSPHCPVSRQVGPIPIRLGNVGGENDNK